MGQEMAYNWGTPGKKFYEGTPTSDPWSQGIHWKSTNEKGNKYLLSVADENKGRASKGSEELPDWMGGRPESQASSLMSGKTARNSITSATSSQLNDAVSELKGFNTQLKDELNELKGYLKQTNDRLQTLETDGTETGRSRATTMRSRSSAGYSQRTRSTARSNVSSVINDARATIARASARSRAE